MRLGGEDGTYCKYICESLRRNDKAEQAEGCCALARLGCASETNGGQLCHSDEQAAPDELVFFQRVDAPPK
jgi:hypothetical protein